MDKYRYVQNGMAGGLTKNQTPTNHRLCTFWIVRNSVYTFIYPLNCLNVLHIEMLFPKKAHQLEASLQAFPEAACQGDTITTTEDWTLRRERKGQVLGAWMIRRKLVVLEKDYISRKKRNCMQRSEEKCFPQFDLYLLNSLQVDEKLVQGSTYK